MFSSRLKETRNFYERIVVELKEQHSAREAQLKEQIEDLRKMVFSPTSAQMVSSVAREADAIITVSERRVLEDDKEDAIDHEMHEADMIFSGMYEEGLS